MTTFLKIPCSLDEISSELHFIPAEIQNDGNAYVESYFESTIRTQDGGKMTASLRGRPLHGTKLEIPSGYTGLIFNETRKPFTEDEDRELTSTRCFTSFNYWNLDCQPGQGDNLQQALAWIDIAKALHSPIDSGQALDSQGSLQSEVSM